MNNISSLLDFLSINREDVQDITPLTTNDGDTILITLKKKECICPHCKSDSYRLKDYKKPRNDWFLS